MSKVKYQDLHIFGHLQAQFNVMRMHVQGTLCLNGFRVMKEKSSVLPVAKKKLYCQINQKQPSNEVVLIKPGTGDSSICGKESI